MKPSWEYEPPLDLVSLRASCLNSLSVLGGAVMPAAANSFLL